MRDEQIFILQVCNFINPDEKKIMQLLSLPLDYPYVLGQLLFNRMGAIAYYTLKNCNVLHKLNREFRNTLKSIYEVGIEKTRSMKKAIKFMSSILSDDKFPYAVLKGSFLVDEYPEGLRTSNDIDFLIEQENISFLSGKLKNEGFIQGNIKNDSFSPSSRKEIIMSRMNRGETVPYIKKINYTKMEFLEIDINFSLDYKATSNENIAQLLNNRQLMNSGLYTLSLADFIIHLCVHLYKEATTYSWVKMNRDLSIYKFFDIYFLLFMYLNEELCNQLIEKIIEYDLKKECYYSFLYSSQLFELKNYMFENMINAIKPEKMDFLQIIIDPGTNQVLKYDESFIDWLFCSNRKEKLYEVRNV